MQYKATKKPSMKFKKIILEHLLKDRTYLDYWSLAHFIFGLIIGFLLKFTGLNFLTLTFISLFIFAFWEIIEPTIVFKHIIIIKFKENIKNQIMDIVYGYFGFLVYWFCF